MTMARAEIEEENAGGCRYTNLRDLKLRRRDQVLSEIEKMTNKGITSFGQKLNSLKNSFLVFYSHHNVDCRIRKK